MSIAICLSGGGFRASIFHLGVLKRLHELDLLKEVTVISAASGGSVTAACFHQEVDHHFKAGQSAEKPKQLERTYDWDRVETRLLGVTARGVLHAYMKAMGIWLTVGVALILLQIYNLLVLPSLAIWFPRWLAESFWLLFLCACLLIVVLYGTLVPVAYRHAIARQKRLAAMKKLNPGRTELSYDFAVPPWRYALVGPLWPDLMRLATLDADLYDHKLLGTLDPSLLLFMATVELNRGREMIFSNSVLAGLGKVGCVALWEQRPDFGEATYFSSLQHGYPFSTSYDVGMLPLAAAVAASSAYPPFFAPVTLYRQHPTSPLLGTFVDGGVADNAALNTPLEMLLHLTREHPRYAEHTRLLGFSDAIDELFVANAGAVLARAPARWTGWRIIRRVLDIIGNEQQTNADIKLAMLKGDGGPSLTVIAPQVDLPDEHPLASSELTELVGRIRTHFDRFDPIETAVLMYLGYYWTAESLARRSIEPPRCKSFAEIAACVAGAERVASLSKEDIVLHLSYSNRRMAIMRSALRALAKARRWIGKSRQRARPA